MTSSFAASVLIVGSLAIIQPSSSGESVGSAKVDRLAHGGGLKRLRAQVFQPEGWDIVRQLLQAKETELQAGLQLSHIHDALAQVIFEALEQPREIRKQLWGVDH